MRIICKNFHKICSKFRKMMNKSSSNRGIPPVKTSIVNLSSQNVNNLLKVLPTPIKSESDNKDYKVIQLQNGLIACLIADKPLLTDEDEEMCEEEEMAECSSEEEDSGTSEDSDDEDMDTEEEDQVRHCKRPEQKLAAAGLCINVGSFSDPKDVPGMAHFLEHMVFMGSEKYPKENSFDEFIKLHGGSDNAITDAENTVFYFECLDKHLEEALDRFSQFFISPLMKKEAMTRERESIDSEFQLAVPSDSSRKEQLLCSLAKTESPVNSFAWGNLITLRDNVNDDELYEKVHEFRKRHYSAHRMTLAVQARMSLEQLEQYVVRMFSNVPNNQLPGDNYGDKDVFNTAAFNRLYHVVPIKDLYKVDITWALPSLLNKYKSKSQHFLSHLLGDEGKGSLLSYLKKKLWVISSSSGNSESGIEHNSLYTLFTINLNLTAEGFKHLNQVIEVVFSYIKMLKQIGPQQRIFNELQVIMNTNFKFMQEQNAIDIIEDMCEAMQYFASEDYITGSELYYEFDPATIQMILDQMCPEKANYMVFKRLDDKEIENCQTEKWFGTKYFVRDIPQDWLKQWQNAPLIPELSIPPVNCFITTEFSILPDVDNNPEFPTKILQSDLVELWYKRDMKFKLPKAHYYFYLITPLSLKSAKNSCMLFALVNLLVIDIAEEIYPATSANLACSFAEFEKGLTIKIHGLNEKLPILIKLVSKYLKNLPARITEEMFEVIKDKLLKYCNNTLLKPDVIAREMRLNLLVDKHWDPLERVKAMSEITFEDIKNYIEEFLKTFYVKVLVQGNVDSDTAITTIDQFIKTLNYNQLNKQDIPLFKVTKLDKGEKCLRLKCFEPSNRNSIITNYYQSDLYSIETSIMFDIVSMIIEEPLFDILRTKEQLGYDVSCTVRDTFGVLGFIIKVKASATKVTTEFVNQRIEAFLKHTKSLLANLNAEDFEKIKTNLIKTKRCTDVHLQDEVERNWEEITNEYYTFDRIKKEIEAIECCGLKKLRKWWEAHNSKNLRKLSVQIEGCKDTEKSEEILELKLQLISNEIEATARKDKSYFITDIEGFKKSADVFSVR
ncbi:unnamed protein product [Ceutorhynchus assimilis]|uniref:Nardilysin n=1 Tax=Ceutorhynchus assimilis TaxID=467358 RepID=A0A9N9QB72_9CUCU|nr:unnamed protein product [Ceutorhynchus assimilis]